MFFGFLCMNVALQLRQEMVLIIRENSIPEWNQRRLSLIFACHNVARSNLKYLESVEYFKATASVCKLAFYTTTLYYNNPWDARVLKSFSSSPKRKP